MYVYKLRPIILLLAAFTSTSVFALQGSVVEDGSNAIAVHQIGYTGSGINVGLISANNTRDSHEAFEDANGVSHAFVYDFTDDGYGITYSGHDTAMAGIVCSRGGVTHPNDIGVAPGADIHSGRVVDEDNVIYLSYVEDALEELVRNQGCRVIVSGIQLSSTPDGQGCFSMLYDYYAYCDDVVFANAAGNFIYDSNNVLITDKITVFGDAYNGITTGGLRFTDPNVYGCVGSRSCGGPTQDGRNKPEVVAPSGYQTVPYANSNTHWTTVGTNTRGATSYAVPHTAGVAALLLDYVANGPAVDANAGYSVVIKAVIVNSTFPNINDKNGNPTNPADPNNVWHNERGYGRIDVLRAVKTIAGGRIYNSDTNIITAVRGWAYDSINGEETHTYKFDGGRNERLVLTVTWHRAVEYKPLRKIYREGQEFDLDVIVHDSEGEKVCEESGSLNNLEKIDINLPADDIYTASLVNTTSNSQAYGLAFEFLPPLIGDFNLDYIVDTTDLTAIMSRWLEAVGLELDIVQDGIINFADVAGFAENWLMIDKLYFSE